MTATPLFVPGETKHHCGTVVDATTRKLCGEWYADDVYRFCPAPPVVLGIQISPWDILDDDTLAGNTAGLQPGYWQPPDPANVTVWPPWPPPAGSPPTVPFNDTIVGIRSNLGIATQSGTIWRDPASGPIPDTVFTPTQAELMAYLGLDGTVGVFTCGLGLVMGMNEAGDFLYSWEATWDRNLPAPPFTLYHEAFSAVSINTWDNPVHTSFDSVTAGSAHVDEYPTIGGPAGRISDSGAYAFHLFDAATSSHQIKIGATVFTTIVGTPFLRGLREDGGLTTGYVVKPEGPDHRSVAFLRTLAGVDSYPLEADFPDKSQMISNPNMLDQTVVAVGDASFTLSYYVTLNNAEVYRREPDGTLTPIAESVWGNSLDPLLINDAGHCAVFVSTGTESGLMFVTP